jgi:hypothetical protein
LEGGVVSEFSNDQQERWTIYVCPECRGLLREGFTNCDRHGVVPRARWVAVAVEPRPDYTHYGSDDGH